MDKLVLFLDEVHPILEERLIALGMRTVHDYTSSFEALAPELPKYQGVVIRSRIPLNNAFLEACSNLEFIARSGAGLENIDTDYCEARKIHLFSAPEGNMDAVGEHAIAMLLSLFNKLNQADAQVRSGAWNREENRGVELMGKTVGIIGFGHMGQAFARRLTGFGVEVIAYDPRVPQSKLGRMVSLKELKAEADVVSLHTPLTEATDGMVDFEFLTGFKKPFYLINTARGQIVKTSDLLKALEEGMVLGACLDVLEYETSSFTNLFIDKAIPKDFQSLLNHKKVIFSPHVAGWTHESYRKLSEVLAEKVENHYSAHSSSTPERI